MAGERDAQLCRTTVFREPSAQSTVRSPNWAGGLRTVTTTRWPGSTAVGDRQFDRDAGAAFGAVRRHDRAAVRLDELAGDRQPEPAAA